MPRRLADILDKQTDFRKATTERAGAILVRPAKPKQPAATRLKVVGRLEAELDTNDLATGQPLSVHEWDTGTSTYLPTGERVTVWGSPARRLGKLLYQHWAEAEKLADRWLLVAGGKARSIEVEFRVDFVETDATVSCSVVDFRDGEDPDPADAGLDVLNTSSRFRGTAGAAGTALYDPELDQYYLIQADCPAVS